MDDETSDGNIVTDGLRQMLMVPTFLMWLMLHVIVTMMVVVVSITGRISRWIGGWRADLGMDFNAGGKKREEILYGLHKEI